MDLDPGLDSTIIIVYTSSQLGLLLVAIAAKAFKFKSVRFIIYFIKKG